MPVFFFWCDNVFLMISEKCLYRIIEIWRYRNIVLLFWGFLVFPFWAVLISFWDSAGACQLLEDRRRAFPFGIYRRVWLACRPVWVSSYIMLKFCFCSSPVIAFRFVRCTFISLGFLLYAYRIFFSVRLPGICSALSSI